MNFSEALRHAAYGAKIRHNTWLPGWYMIYNKENELFYSFNDRKVY